MLKEQKAVLVGRWGFDSAKAPFLQLLRPTAIPEGRECSIGEVALPFSKYGIDLNLIWWTGF
jgi:hypothetical protein